MTSPRYLTKSRFKLAVECPTKLYYTSKKDVYKDILADNDFLAMLADGGYQVGELAKYRYPSGIEIHEKEHEAAEAKTREYLKQENVVLFEPAIRVGNFFIRIDILVKRANQYEIIEVKAKSYNSINPKIRNQNGSIKPGYLPYFQDIAFQTWILRQAIPSAEIKSFLMMPDKSKKSSVDGINQMFKVSRKGGVTSRVPNGLDVRGLAEELLEKVSADEFVHEILNNDIKYPGGKKNLSDAALEWAKAYAEDRKIPPKIGAHCGKCQFKTHAEDTLKSGFHECWKQANNWTDADFEGGTVLDIWHSRKKDKFIAEGRCKLSNISREDLTDDDEDAPVSGLTRSQRQALQVSEIPADYDHGGFYFDAALFAFEQKNKWHYPYHQIDFETAAVALPFHKDMRPYEQVAFQFSHHIMEPDGSVRHQGQFICVEPGIFPNYEFARALKGALENDNGTIFMWSHHENTILSAIIQQLREDPSPPEDAKHLIEFIQSITKDGVREMYDLCRLSEKIYFHPDTKGSTSIKKVLPAILKTSKYLQETYSKPTYGAPNGIPSINFASSSGFSWLDKAILGDPYAVLKKYAEDLIPEGMGDSDDEGMSLIAEGGAAATAYARLQFEDLTDETRERITSSLLRYCELDTLAMVMIMQGWQSFIED